MARAKRTVRADARRRYRATAPVDATPIEGDEELADAPVDKRSPARPERAGRASASAPPRPGFMSTFRAAAGRPMILEDVKALPQIAFHSKALWIPFLVIATSAVLFVIPGVNRNPFVTMLGTIALQPPPMIMPFLGGMLAPRGAWLVGGIIGLANSLGFIILVVANTNSQVTPLGWTYTVTSDQKVAYGISALMSAVPFGILVGAFAGFYRRFLSSSAPARQADRSKRR